MRNSRDPQVHREREQELVRHVERLLSDDRLRVDTTRGRRTVTSLMRDVNEMDKGVELKRRMSELGKTDRELESRMPVGKALEVVLSRRAWGFLKSPVGRLRVMCVSPTEALLKGEEPRPLGLKDVQKALGEVPPPLKGVPTTLVMLSTSGFTIEAHELAERRADRTLILVEPNDAGGWSVAGPVETKALVDLFDPEAEEEKRRRVREVIEEQKTDLLTSGGIAMDRIAAATKLPVQLIEGEMKKYAEENAGLVAKRLEGRLVLFREGVAPAAATGKSAGGNSTMPLVDKIKTLFSRKGENEKKIAFLAEKRAILGQQRDRSYDELGAMEAKEAELKDQFKQSTSALAKRRITSQLLQFRKDMERRQQFLSVINQQINIVGTHLHSLELVKQGKMAEVEDPDAIAKDAAAAEEMIAQLQADGELAGSFGEMAHTGMTSEEQALYDELERESGGETEKGTSIKLDAMDEESATTPPTKQGVKQPTPRRSNEPEAG